MPPFVFQELQRGRVFPSPCLLYSTFTAIMRFVYLVPFLAAAFAKNILLSARSAQNWTYQGCYLDSTSRRTLAHSSNSDFNDQTVEICTSYCSANGFDWAGLEYGSVCINTVQVSRLTCSQTRMLVRLPAFWGDSRIRIRLFHAMCWQLVRDMRQWRQAERLLQRQYIYRAIDQSWSRWLDVPRMLHR